MLYLIEFQSPKILRTLNPLLRNVVKWSANAERFLKCV